MNLAQLNTFLDVANSQNFNRTAENLSITQSAVSTRIRGLEETLGVTLFTRGRFGAELTSSGVKFRHYALQICEVWSQARQELSLPRGYDGVLRVGTQFSIWEKFVNRWILWMCDRYPRLALHIETDYSISMMEQVVNKMLDIAVMYQPRILLDIEITRLFDDVFVLISTEPADMDSLDKEKYVYIDWCLGFRDAHARAVPELKARRITMGLGTMAIDYLNHKGGSIYLPAWRAKKLVSDGQFHRVTGAPEILQPVYAVYRKDTDKNEIYDAAIDSLRAFAPSHEEMISSSLDETQDRPLLLPHCEQEGG
ncbi:LysR family transcriptional regulator [Oceanimonas sp. MB9]|uniref:LysR family transcriptional regulator n=1 Tax=Oceanimonas sp. MB9 TaxID=2588453 RepID=UPI0013F60365|nr:LysR family transcriptional regulator [Oceanimonas sp. MB9]NHI01836.1 HTH-type transcriptional regulator YofA [Oceanimonas sp. MB9]